MRATTRPHFRGSLVTFVLFAILLLLLAGLAFYFLFRAASPPGQDEGRRVATQFLDALRSGQVDAAWESTSAEFKSMLGLEGFRDYIRKHPALTAPADCSEVIPQTRNGLALAECVFRPTDGKATIRVLVAREAEAPRVEHVTVE